MVKERREVGNVVFVLCVNCELCSFWCCWTLETSYETCEKRIGSYIREIF